MSEDESEYFSKDDERLNKLSNEFRKSIECPYKEGCRFFKQHSVVEDEGRLPNSIFSYVLSAERCEYQFADKRGSKFAPRGLDEACKFEGDIGPAVAFENYCGF
ncbi:MAG: hypothetical protein PVJ67_06400 [Candidatus Pacearchaeota archaeon]|jgi:hypothetical protein